jgi:hypothetical protein
MVPFFIVQIATVIKICTKLSYLEGNNEPTLVPFMMIASVVRGKLSMSMLLIPFICSVVGLSFSGLTLPKKTHPTCRYTPLFTKGPNNGIQYVIPPMPHKLTASL